MSKQASQVYVWDFTIGENFVDEGGLKLLLSRIAKKWVFQLKKGAETGFMHYQGRCSFKEKTRKPTSLGMPPQGHYSPTSGANKDNNYYVMKTDTRVRGPFNDEEEVIFIPRQIQEIKELYPWQQTVVESAGVFDTRTINIIIDKQGNNGKSILKTWIGCKRLGRALPYFNDYKDFMRIVMDCPKMKLYILDIPRAIRKDKLNGFFGGIESLKDGYAYDDRYSFKEAYFDSPQVWVFMNVMPERGMLSRDRWRFWVITPSKTLEAYEFQEEEIV